MNLVQYPSTQRGLGFGGKVSQGSQQVSYIESSLYQQHLMG